MKLKHILILILATCMSAQLFAQSSETIQVGRYVETNTGLQAYQHKLLSQVVTMNFPEDVKTINGAVEYLLRFSGYRLISSNEQQKAMKSILRQKLPVSLRAIKNATIEQALIGLVGDDFQVVYDPIHRLIAFRLKGQARDIYDSTYIAKKKIIKEVQ